MKRFFEFYQQISQEKLLREDNMAGNAFTMKGADPGQNSMGGNVASTFAMGAANAQKTGDVNLGMGADPIPLSKIASNPAIAQSMTKGGLADNNPSDDVITAEFKMVLPSALFPTQSTLVSEKVLGMIQTGIKTPAFLQDMKAIVSQDNAIMDGHHRWAAALVLNPKQEVNVLRMSLPLERLITVLNIYTVGALNVTKGNPSKGETIAEAFDKLKQLLPTIPPELLAQVPGASDANSGLSILMQNIDAIGADQKKNKTNLPREQMPVIPPDGMDATQVLQALANAANSGELDIKAPLSTAVQKALTDAGVASTGGQANPTHNQNIATPTGQGAQQGLNAGAEMQYQPDKANAEIAKELSKTKTSGNNRGAAGASMAGTPMQASPMPGGISFGMQPQNASTFHPGLNLHEQMLVLSGVLTVEQAEKKNKKKSK